MIKHTDCLNKILSHKTNIKLRVYQDKLDIRHRKLCKERLNNKKNDYINEFYPDAISIFGHHFKIY